MRLYAVDNVPIGTIDLGDQIRGPFPDVKVPIVGPRDDVVRVVAQEVRLLDVSRCIAVAQETRLVVTGG